MKAAAVSKPSVGVREVAVDAMMIALTLAATMFVNLRLPIASNGGLIHLGNVPLILASILLGKRTGAIAGAFGMGLFDLMAGWAAWAPGTFITVGIMGYVMGVIAGKRNGESFWLNTLAVIAATAIKLAGYYVTELIIYGNWLAPFASFPGGLVQMGVAAVIALPLVPVLKAALRRTRRA